jgi:hypothetical protein
MISQGLDALPAAAAWRPFLEWPASGWDKLVAGRVWRTFLDWIAASPQDYHLVPLPTIASLLARDWWDAEFRKKYSPEAIISDPWPGASPTIFRGSATARTSAPSGMGFSRLGCPHRCLRGTKRSA